MSHLSIPVSGVCVPSTDVAGDCVASVAAGAFVPFSITNPANQSIFEGEDAVFSSVGTGVILHWQWQVSTDGLNWEDIVGENAATLTVANAQLSDNGKQYRVLASDSISVATSNPATLTVAVETFGYAFGFAGTDLITDVPAWYDGYFVAPPNDGVGGASGQFGIDFAVADPTGEYIRAFLRNESDKLFILRRQGDSMNDFVLTHVNTTGLTNKTPVNYILAYTSKVSRSGRFITWFGGSRSALWKNGAANPPLIGTDFEFFARQIYQIISEDGRYAFGANPATGFLGRFDIDEETWEHVPGNYSTFSIFGCSEDGNRVIASSILDPMGRSCVLEKQGSSWVEIALLTNENVGGSGFPFIYGCTADCTKLVGAWSDGGGETAHRAHLWDIVNGPEYSPGVFAAIDLPNAEPFLSIPRGPIGTGISADGHTILGQDYVSGTPIFWLASENYSIGRVLSIHSTATPLGPALMFSNRIEDLPMPRYSYVIFSCMTVTRGGKYLIGAGRKNGDPGISQSRFQWGPIVLKPLQTYYTP